MKRLKNLLTMFAFICCIAEEIHEDDHHYSKHVEIYKEIKLPKEQKNKYI